MFPLNLVLMAFFFFGIKSGRIAVMKLVPILNSTLHVTLVMATCCSKFNLIFFNRKTRYYLLNLISQTINRSLGMHIFLKIASIAKKVQ